MPIFDYKCMTCAEVTTKLVRKTEDEPVRCSCGGVPAKQIGAPGFVLTGDGFCNRGRGSAGSA